LFSGERSFEISKKIRKRTNFEYLIFRIRIKFKEKGERLISNVNNDFFINEKRKTIFGKKFDEEKLIFDKYNSIQEAITEEIENKSNVEKKVLFFAKFCQSKNESCLGLLVFKIRKNWSDNIWKYGNVIGTISSLIRPGEEEEKIILDPGWSLIIRYPQKVENFIEIIGFKSMLISPVLILISSITIESFGTLIMDKMLIVYNFLIANGKSVGLMLKASFTDKGEFLNWIRVIISVEIEKKNKIRVIFCSEFGGVIFPLFVKLLVNLKVYHEAKGLKITSFQFRDEKVYVIEIVKVNNYMPTRILDIHSKELKELKHLNISGAEIWEKFNPIFIINSRPREKIIDGVFENENVLIISSNFDAMFNLIPGMKCIRRGVNRIQKTMGKLKGGVNVIHLKVYGSVLDINVEENTSAVMLFNTVAAWMGVDPSSINIEICIVGKAVEGMGHILTKDDSIWDGRYNFVWNKVKLVKKKMNIENYKFDPVENMDIMVDLNTIKFNVRMNKYLKIKSVEKIIEERFMKE
jgi:hypothetical protein